MANVELMLDGPVALITLNDSRHGNLLRPESLATLQEQVAAADGRPEVRVLVLRAAGDPFCLGMDLSLLPAAAQDPAGVESALALYARVLHSIHTISKPVLCLVQGAVKAGGLGLVCACDIILASEEATFEMSEVLFGLLPANVLPWLFSLRVLPQKIRYLVLCAKQLAAQAALQLQLVDEVAPAAEMEKAARSLVKRLLQASPRALAETKRFTQALPGLDQAAAMQAAQKIFMDLIRDPEVVPAIQGFLNGQKLPWSEPYRPSQPLILGGGA